MYTQINVFKGNIKIRVKNILKTYLISVYLDYIYIERVNRPDRSD